MEILCRLWPPMSRVARASPDEPAHAGISRCSGARRAPAFSPPAETAAAETRGVSVTDLSRQRCPARFEPSPAAPLADAVAPLSLNFAHRDRVRATVLAARRPSRHAGGRG